jgi:alanine dehydrogenase
MLIGVPKEIKTHEYRVGLTPDSVRALCGDGQRVLVQAGAGAAIGLDDSRYRAAGAEIVATAEEVFARAELIVKVKEPQPHECRQLHAGQALFAYLHLAPDPEQARLLLASGVTAIAYETVTDAGGGLPLLAPMSEVAGRMSIQVAAHCLEKPQGGSGLLLSGATGVAPAAVLVLGGGTVGCNAAQIAAGMNSRVAVVEPSAMRRAWLAAQFGERVRLLEATPASIESALAEADVVVGAALVPGAATPQLVGRAQLARLRPGSVLVDVSIDQGGCFATSRPTTHAAPTFVVDGIVHYCVANMPGAVPRTSTFALNAATLPRMRALAAKGWRQALRDDPQLRAGLNVDRGAITHAAVAAALGLPFSDPVAHLG